MAASGPQLEDEQRDELMGWLAAEYSTRLIQHLLRERGWPVLARQSIWEHRQRFAAEIERRRTERRSKALTTGLAVKEERLERLKENADWLATMKEIPDSKGRLHNEKAWREALEQIEIETGQRNAAVEPGGVTKVLIEVRVEEV